MKKVMKLVALVLAMMLVVVSFAGCGKDKKFDSSAPSNNNTATEAPSPVAEAKPEDAVKGFFEAIKDVDFEGATKFLKEDVEGYDYLKNAKEELFDGLTRDMGIEGVRPEHLQPLFDAAFDKMSYKITDSKVDGETAELKVEFATPKDFEALFNSSLEDIDQEKIMTDFVAEKGYDMESFADEASKWTEEEINDFELEMVFYLLDIVVENIENANSFETDVLTSTVKLEKEGNNWIISEMDEEIIGSIE